MIRTDDIAITTAEGAGTLEVFNDANSLVALRVELRGASATMTAGTCTLTTGGTSTASPVVTYSTAGEATFTVTAAHLSTIGASLWQEFEAHVELTITDGVSSQTARVVIRLVVASRRYTWALAYSDIETLYPEVSNAYALPTGQSNLWPQVRIKLRQMRNLINREGGDVATWMVQSPDDFRELATAYAMLAVAEFMDAESDGKTMFWPRQIERWKGEIKSLWPALKAFWAVSATSHGTKPEAVMTNAKKPILRSGRGSGFGGPL